MLFQFVYRCMILFTTLRIHRVMNVREISVFSTKEVRKHFKNSTYIWIFLYQSYVFVACIEWIFNGKGGGALKDFRQNRVNLLVCPMRKTWKNVSFFCLVISTFGWVLIKLTEHLPKTLCSVQENKKIKSQLQLL